MLVVVVEIDLTPMAFCKAPGVPRLGQGIDNTARYMEGLHQPVEFFPVAVDIEVDEPVPLADDNVQVFALVDTHEAGTVVALGNAFAAAESQDLLDCQTVRCFDVSHADLEIVEVGQVIRRPELMEDSGRGNEVREELTIMPAPFVRNSGSLRYPLTD